MDKQYLNDEITAAMRAHDKPRVSILRLVKNEIDTQEKTSGEELPDAAVTDLLKKVLKQTRETLDASMKAGTNEERTHLLAEQVGILEGYLPEQISGDALAAVVDAVLAEGGFSEKRDMGKAIGAVVAQTGGNVDKAEVAKLVGAKLA